MREDGVASDKPLDIAVLTRMKQFRAMNKLKKVALKVSLLSVITIVALWCIIDLVKYIAKSEKKMSSTGVKSSCMFFLRKICIILIDRWY